MKTQLRAKLRSRRGETLVETVVALLVIVLSSALLASLVMAANHLNATALQRDALLYSQMDATQRRDGTKADGTVKVTDRFGRSATYEVSYYGEEKGLTSYGGKGGGKP